MAYAWHQSGGFSAVGRWPSAASGRSDRPWGQRRDIHLKGSGAHALSRGGDGKAVLGPVLREYLFGEAMHALGIPTTRALAATLTGEAVMRQKGPGTGGSSGTGCLLAPAGGHVSVLCRAGRGGKGPPAGRLCHQPPFPEIAARDDKYLEFFRRVREAQASLIAQWVHVGFVHGVMNTDNTTISGETIDYGPCAFIDAYDPKAVFSSIDEHGRYSFGNQPPIMQWNLSRFAETLIDLVNPDDSEDAVRQLTNEINAFPAHYQMLWLKGMRAKLGLFKELPGDLELANDLLSAAQDQRGWITQACFGPWVPLCAATSRQCVPFCRSCGLRCLGGSLPEQDARRTARADLMDQVNPIYIPRNHLVDAALSAAVAGDMAPRPSARARDSAFKQEAGAEDIAPARAQ